MMDFIVAAFPWLVMGLSLAVALVNLNRTKANNYGMVGMLFGMSIGLTLASSLPFSRGNCMAMGMMLGLALGSCFEWSKKDEDGEA